MQLAELEQNYCDIGWGADWRSDTIARAIFDFMKEAHDFVQEDCIVLDISAGQALYKPFYQHAHYIALDAAVGDKNWDFSRLDVIADAMYLPIRNASADVCLNFTSLEHYPEPWAFFREVGRVLKPGGELFLFVPHVMHEHQIPYDFFRYTQYGLKHMCVSAGLEVVSVKPVCSVFFTITRAIDFLEQSVVTLGGNLEVMQYLANTKATLTNLSHQYDEKLKDLPREREAISQWPMQYMLRAKKPGVLVPQKHSSVKHELLSDILADPFEKKPIVWDGVATEIGAEFSNRRYPVVNGVPRFMY